MSLTRDHFERSLEKVWDNFPEIFRQEEGTVREILHDLHNWLDFYSGRQGKDREGEYDFTGRLAIRHRAKRHHLEGVILITDILSSVYGQRFAEIIRQEAERHIYDDMGCILFAADYRQIGFWKNYE